MEKTLAMEMKNYVDTSGINIAEERGESVFQSLAHQLNGVLSMLLLTISTLFWFTVLIIVAFLKFLIPIKGWRNLCTIILNGIAVTWISINNLNLDLTKRIKWEVTGLEGLSLKGWYLVISNHQTWVDIVVLQKIFNRKIPFLKFFLKKELIWVPLLGIAWWALDFPFMKRYSAEFLKKHPKLKGKDIEITRKACEKFKTTPVSVMNFVEGTRFTKEKHDRQESPFKNLLKPKAGGIGFVLSAMGERLNKIVNVMIIYPEGEKGFWAFLCNRIHEIRVRVEVIPITDDMRGDYIEDKEFQGKFQGWLNSVWVEKDKLFEHETMR